MTTHITNQPVPPTGPPRRPSGPDERHRPNQITVWSRRNLYQLIGVSVAIGLLFVFGVSLWSGLAWRYQVPCMLVAFLAGGAAGFFTTLSSLRREIGRGIRSSN